MKPIGNGQILPKSCYPPLASNIVGDSASALRTNRRNSMNSTENKEAIDNIEIIPNREMVHRQEVGTSGVWYQNATVFVPIWIDFTAISHRLCVLKLKNSFHYGWAGVRTARNIFGAALQQFWSRPPCGAALWGGRLQNGGRAGPKNVPGRAVRVCAHP